MDVCRICLSSQAEKNISQLQIRKKGDTESYIEILSFCLNIQIEEDSKISKKLCSKCYKKVINFHKFKSLALKNDAYLKSIDRTTAKIDADDISNNNPIEILDNENDCNIEKVKEEPNIKEEVLEEIHDDHSDDELLSVIKNIKYEYVIDETKENVSTNNNQPAPVKKRGRPKQLKTQTDSKTHEFCDQCGKVVWNLREHSFKHMPLEDRKRIKCKDCDKMFSSYGARYRHCKIKHLGLKPHCNICNKDVVDLKHHHLVMHNSKELPFECVMCGRRFISPSALEAHITTHTKDKPFECDICQKKFRIKVLLMHHIRQVHDKEKSHLCQYCSKSFFKKYHLQIHLRRHTKEKPYQCPQCDKAFSSSSGLNSHQLIHSGVKSFECTLCDSSFAKPGYLRNHMLSHTKEKKHACKYCGLKFGRSDHRKRHEWTAHEKHVLAA